ncbi:MAG: hypothetical protein P9C55_01525 [Defluviicoccus sp.]|nr:hypothetical protein [Defluviicoccus sp.]
MTPAQKALLEKRDGWDVGRDPRAVSRDELIAAGHKPMSAQKALRARCLDCCVGSANEVRLCPAVSCPAWPFRLGSSPWRPPANEARQEAQRQAGARLALRQSAPTAHKEQVATPMVPATTLPAEPSARPSAQTERAFQAQATLSVEDAR